ncbi:MAG: hypothetical protein CM1200mP30_17800 [Pseudomonadota bacterium]|nr:MAG: hypothetical protein CM1200mP30_17800 [Pseudomonadota bacterium]
MQHLLRYRAMKPGKRLQPSLYLAKKDWKSIQQDKWSMKQLDRDFFLHARFDSMCDQWMIIKVRNYK